jgi:putative ABC transport system ATP-binding protein
METSERETILKLQNISVVFARGTIDEVTALNNISLDVQSEDFITVIGSNGAGKSTMLNIVAGVYPPEKGSRIVINGKDVTGLSEHRRAKFVGRVY